jgi:nitrogen regulatory protein PII-like uncharacterized protein
MSSSSNHNLIEWSESDAITASLEKNHIEIVQLDRKNCEHVIALTSRNADVTGFDFMDPEVLSGDKFKEILTQQDEDDECAIQCYVAKEKSSNNIVGFIIFDIQENPANEDGCLGAIHALGVDENYSWGRAKLSGAHNVGSSLLLVACNQMFNHEVDAIITLPSDGKSEKFYKKYGFVTDANDADEEDLVLTKNQYQSLESAILKRAGVITEDVVSEKSEINADNTSSNSFRR